MSYMPVSKNQQHITPNTVHEISYHEWGLDTKSMYDPCPIDTPYKAPCFFNGLYGIWKEWNYVNCPFEVKTLRLFYNKSLEQSALGNHSVMLLPSKTDQDWFHDILDKQFHIKWIRGRLKFKGNKHSAMGGHFLVKIQISTKMSGYLQSLNE